MTPEICYFFPFLLTALFANIYRITINVKTIFVKLIFSKIDFLILR